ncbi:MAG: hypothetical protein ACYSWS_00750 [Planctomycetota bacterium]|jgi:hypothetical protein
MVTEKEAFEGVKILFFKDAYTIEGIEITFDRMNTLLESGDLKEQIRETMEEKDEETKAIMKLTLPYFLLCDSTTKLSEEDKMGFFTDNNIMGCSYDINYDGYYARSDNVLEQNIRWLLQDMNRDDFNIRRLPKFIYPEHIKDPFRLTSKYNRKLNEKELEEFKEKTAHFWKRGGH